MVDDYLGAKVMRKRPITRRDRLWEFLYSPSSSAGALTFALFLMLCVVMATAIPAVREWKVHAGTFGGEQILQRNLIVFEGMLGGVFTLELVLRLISLHDKHTRCPMKRLPIS